MKYSQLREIESLLIRAADQLPGPQKPVPIASCMKRPVRPARPWRTVATVLLLLCLSATTALAASPQLRDAVIRFFTSGTVEQPPVDLLTPGSAGETIAEETGSPAENDSVDGNPADRVQTVGSLTLVRPASLDTHFSAFYVSSDEYLEWIRTPSGIPLFGTRPDHASPVYYALENGVLQEIRLESHTLTASVRLGILPGVMGHGGEKDFWEVALPPMQFTVNWQQYGNDILIDNTDTDVRFDIGSTFGGLPADYDGRFYSRAIPGRGDVVQVFFNFDGQQTEYEYPFLLYLDDGRVSDPLAGIDLSAYPCITELALSDDLLHATAQAGADHEHLHPITIDLATGSVTESPLPEPPQADCYLWFPTGEHTLFYGVGGDDDLTGYWYDTESGRQTLLFSGAASRAYEDGFAESYYEFIGGGYAVYYEKDSVSLLDLHDGSSFLLEGVPNSRLTNFFFNPDFTVLSVTISAEDGRTQRLGFIVLETGEAAYFERELPDGIQEVSASWYAPGGYMIQAVDEARERYYLYLYALENTP